ncbi:MAG: ComF family protein [Thermodesulfobacteriota bacterium]|nr:ComF family protein [Thermodesulfobacteriota bacterium]
MHAFFSHVIKSMTDAIYPPGCFVCGEPYDDAHKNACSRPPPDVPDREMHPYLCSGCAAAFTPIQSPMCTVCGRMFASADAEDHVCGDCTGTPKRFNSARAVGLYTDSLMALIHQLKYNGRTGLARSLGALLYKGFFRWYDPRNIDMIVPVPLHGRKFRQRGFNQSYLLIRQWGRSVDISDSGIDTGRIIRNVIVRQRNTRSQTTLSRKERQENVRGAFQLTDPAMVKDKRILVIDDVYTTGATVNECARTLMAGGAARVDVLTLARVGGAISPPVSTPGR